jgi:Na+-driven multidrug efflux pump
VLEFLKICKLAVPSIAINSLEILMFITDNIFVGQHGRGNLAVLSVGTSYFNIIWLFIEGVLTAQDTLSSQASGMNDPKHLRQWLYAASAVSIVLCLLGTILMFFSYMIFLDGFLAATHIAFKAMIHVILLIPSLWSMAAFRVLQKYLLAQQSLAPVVMWMGVAFGVNALGRSLHPYRTFSCILYVLLC